MREAANAGYGYNYYGLHLRSDLPLSLLPPRNREESAPDVSLRIGEVPAALEDAVWSSPFVAVDAGGAALIELRDCARVLIRRGKDIVVAPALGALPLAVEMLLLGPTAGALLHQRGALPLHAGCVEIGGMALAFCGPCGRGKSTLVRAFLDRGATLLSDDISVVRFGGDGAPEVMPGSGGVRLWPDTRAVLRRPDETWSPIRPGHSKQVAASQNLANGPHRLGAVIRLARPGASAPGLRRLHGAAALMPTPELVYRAAVGRHMGRREGLFHDLMRLAAVTPVFELQRPHGLDRLPEAMDWIQSALARVA